MAFDLPKRCRKGASITQHSVTISDVAGRAGVSITTVSSALNNSGRVSVKTRDRVQRAAQELGYIANLSARSLKGGRTNVLGVVLGELRSPVYAELAASISESARTAGMDTLLYTTFNDPSREHQRVSSLIDGLCDGLLILLPKESEAELRAFEQSRVPVVLINHHGAVTKLPVVGADNYHGVRAAIRHLTGLGHQRIAFVTGKPQSGQSPERLRAYRDELTAAGLPFDETLVRIGDWSQVRGFTAACELLDLAQPPSAILTANDQTAFGVMDAVKDRNLRVPDDVSVVGFDDIPAASFVHPPLTTVRHPFGDIAKAGVQLLLDLISGRTTAPARVELPSELVVRSSTGPASRR